MWNGQKKSPFSFPGDQVIPGFAFEQVFQVVKGPEVKGVYISI